VVESKTAENFDVRNSIASLDRTTEAAQQAIPRLQAIVDRPWWKDFFPFVGTTWLEVAGYHTFIAAILSTIGWCFGGLLSKARRTFRRRILTD
jgi:hypothetical protein